jgi:hypothetical protein
MHPPLLFVQDGVRHHPEDLLGGGIAEVHAAEGVRDQDALGHDVDDLAQPREPGLGFRPCGLGAKELLRASARVDRVQGDADGLRELVQEREMHVAELGE